MPPKISAEMKEAIRLAMTGISGRDAARQAGVREESLYRNAEYRAWKQGQNSAKTFQPTARNPHE